MQFSPYPKPSASRRSGFAESLEIGKGLVIRTVQDSSTESRTVGFIGTSQINIDNFEMSIEIS